MPPAPSDPQPAGETTDAPDGPGDTAAGRAADRVRTGGKADGDRLLLASARAGAVRLVVLSLLGLAVTGLALWLPVALGHTLDLLLRGRPAAAWVAVCAAIVAGQALLGAAADLIGATAAAHLAAGLRRRAVRRVLDAGPTAGRSPGGGDLVTRLVGNAADAGAAPVAAAALPATLAAPVGGILALALTDPWLAAAFLLGAPPLVLLVQRFARASSDCVSRYQDAQGRIAGRLLEALGGARTIAAAGTEERENARVLRPLPELSAQGHRMWHIQGRATAQAAVLVPLLQIIVLAAGGIRLAQGALSVGDLLAASRYAALATGIGTVVGQIGGLVKGRTAARRIAAVLAVPVRAYGEAQLPAGAARGPDGAAGGAGAGTGADAPPPVPPPVPVPVPGGAGVPGPARVSGACGARPPGAAADTGGGRPSVPASAASRASGSRQSAPHRAGTLELRRVTAVRGGETVLDRLDLTVPGGSCVAVVGRSGAGKSVLAALAGRLLDPEDGTVLLDGRALPELSRAALRAAVAYAFERPVLIGETIGEAIGFGPGLLSPEATAEAARAAGADTFVTRLPAGYATRRADAPMSGGEVQRLGLARAFARSGRLLVLDDATSSLDTVTELHVAQALFRTHRGRTRLLVTHRASTAARADLVAWLDGGRLRAFAPHLELWSDPGYRDLLAAETGAGRAAGAPTKAGRHG